MEVQENIQKIKKNWSANFTNGLEFIVKSPGRINIIGEHTDYNNGFVLPAAIENSIYLGISKSVTNSSKVIALDKNESYVFLLNNLELFPIGSWQNYIIGIIEEVKKKGIQLQNFQIVFYGNIPAGSGLSSSAALENAIVFALNRLFNLGFTSEEMMFISQKAEHNYVGVQCGIMDQFASIIGKENTALFLDCQDLSYKEIEIKMSEYEWVLINSNVQHELASSEYNNRREECESVVSKIGEKFKNINSLRDVNMLQLTEYKEQLNQKEFKRAKYIIEENQRVLNCTKHLKTNRFLEVGKVLFEAHQAMKKEYEITCAETDFLVKKAKENNFVLGARQMGGGFGGCTINLIEKNKIDSFLTVEMEKEYLNLFNTKFEVINIKLGNGTQIIWGKIT